MRKIIIGLLCICSCYVQSQCEIPNGEFEDFTTITNGAGFTFDLPNEWSESIIPNIVNRFVAGNGFFYRYEGPDVNGSALLLQRGQPVVPAVDAVPINSGFIRIPCDPIPEGTPVKLRGKFKFSGSSLGADVIDTLKISSYYSKEIDTLPLVDLHLRTLPERAKTLDIIESTETMTEFEIDLSEFAGQNTEYLTIQFIMISGTSDIPLAPRGFASAVIDELEILYETLSTAENDSRMRFTYFPNPVENQLTIQFPKHQNEINIGVYDVKGRIVKRQEFFQNNEFQLNLENLPSGMYIVKLKSGKALRQTFKVFKR
jgi:hypothetical protein